jgi:hypothetical protein
LLDAHPAVDDAVDETLAYRHLGFLLDEANRLIGHVDRWNVVNVDLRGDFQDLLG